MQGQATLAGILLAMAMLTGVMVQGPVVCGSWATL